jgi:hypothetical protein
MIVVPQIAGIGAIAGRERPSGYAFLTIRSVDQVFPVRLAQFGGGDSEAAKWQKMVALNPHVFNGTSFVGVAGDEINLPDEWVEGVERAGFLVTRSTVQTLIGGAGQVGIVPWVLGAIVLGVGGVLVVRAVRRRKAA